MSKVINIKATSISEDFVAQVKAAKLSVWVWEVAKKCMLGKNSTIRVPVLRVGKSGTILLGVRGC